MDKLNNESDAQFRGNERVGTVNQKYAIILNFDVINACQQIVIS